jgi:polar amino acid transport system permease protein
MEVKWDPMNATGKIGVFKKDFSYYLWVGVFFLCLGGIVAGLYYSTKQIDYVWRWYRVPQYFFFEDTIDVRAEMQGTVASISPADGGKSVTVKNDSGISETYFVPGGDVRVSEGDTIYPADVLGTSKKWRAGLLLQGLWMTLRISVIATFFGLIIGLFGGLFRISSNPALKWAAITYIEIIRGSPLLVQIFIWYFVLGTLFNTLLAHAGLPEIPDLWYGTASLACFAGAYVAEIVRAGIQSIHRGQTEAARSLGMNYLQGMYHVILPQALRRIIPPLAGQFISLIKDSSLLGIIAIRELTKATREVVTTSLQPFEMWFICALLYLVLTFSLSMLTQYLERRMLVS